MSLNALSQGMSGSTTKGYGAQTKGWVTGTGGADAFVDIADPKNTTGTTTPRTITLGAWNATADQNYFTGVLFSKDETDGKWHANPKKYYPLRATVDLLAYSSGTNAITADWESGHKVTLQVTDTQDDILYSSTQASSMAPNATMAFHHSQAWISFKLSANDNAVFHVDSLYWEDVFHSGALHLEFNGDSPTSPTATWDFFTQEKGNVGMDDPFGALFTTASGSTGRTPVAISTDSNNPSQLNMLLPEQPHSSFVVLYTLCGHRFAKRINASDLTSTTWERSKHYTYSLRFNVTDISLAPDVEIWVEETVDRVNSVEIINGVFSTAEGKIVAFSKGNLQYRPSDGKWRFAEHQYDYVGGDVTTGTATTHSGNVRNSTNNPMITGSDGTKRDMTDAERRSYNGWLDLFGWGTSGIDPENGNLYQPWETTKSTADAPVKYGPATDLTRTNDWGVNIRAFEYFRPKEVDGEFRSLSADEWTYLLNTRITKSGHRWFTGTLKWGPNTGENTKGHFLLPDKFVWHESYGKEPTDAQYDHVTTDYTVDNTIGARFDKLEAAGVVFIPYAGRRDGTAMFELGDALHLWTRSIDDATAGTAKCVECLGTGNSVSVSAVPGEKGFSVRLVTDLNPEAIDDPTDHPIDIVPPFTEYDDVL